MTKTHHPKPARSLTLSKELEQSNDLRNKHIQDYAASNNLVLVPFDELEKLKTIDDAKLLSMAQEKGYHLLTTKEYEELMSEEEMRKKLESKGLVTLPQDEYNTMSDKLKSPDKEFITEKANAMGLIVSSTEVYDSLVKNSTDPSIDHLTEMANAKDLTVIANEELDHLKNPTIEEVSEFAAN